MREEEVGFVMALQVSDSPPARHHGVRAPDDARKDIELHVSRQVGRVGDEDHALRVVQADQKRLMTR
jgi:hypothetical protein